MSLSLPLPQTPSLAHSPPWSLVEHDMAQPRAARKLNPQCIEFYGCELESRIVSERTKAAPRHAPGVRALAYDHYCDLRRQEPTFQGRCLLAAHCPPHCQVVAFLVGCRDI